MDDATWSSTVADLSAADVDTSVDAAAKLHAEATESDIPKLLELLRSDDFFVREAAAWPLAEMAGPLVLRELLVAYQRGFAEGQDNDGFTAALLEIPPLHGTEATRAIVALQNADDEAIRSHARWLLEYSETPGAAQ